MGKIYQYTPESYIGDSTVTSEDVLQRVKSSLQCQFCVLVLFLLVLLNFVQQTIQQVIPVSAIEANRCRAGTATAKNVAHHVVPNLGAPSRYLLHGAAHQRHQLRDKVNQAAVVHLPEDFVKLGDVVVEVFVVVRAAPCVAEIRVENVAARLKV